MKLKHLFATLSLAVVAGSGIAAGFSSGNSNVQKAEASFSGGTYLYLKTDDGKWNNDGARFAFAYITPGDTATYWADMTLYDSSLSIYEGFLPAGTWGKLIFCRMDPNGGNDWSHRWNQSSDLTSIDGEYYKVYDYDGKPASNNGAWQDIYYGSRNYNWTMVSSTDGFVTSTKTPIPYLENGTGQAYISLTLTAGTEFYFERDDEGTATDRNWANRDTEDTSMADGAIVASTVSSGNFRAAKKSTLEIFVKPNGKVWVQNDATEDAKTFASTFVSTIESNCPYDYSQGKESGKAASDLVAAWKSEAEAYGHLTDGAKAVLHSTTTSSEGSLADFARVYDYVYGHYAGVRESGNGGNFANRTVNVVANLASPLALQTGNSYTTIVITVVAISLVAIGGFFFYKRKRV